MNFRSIEEKIQTEQAISRQEAEDLFKQGSDQELAHLASLTRKRFHRPNEATYLIMAIINYTNVCVAKCDYCSFYRLPHQEGTYLLSFEELCERIDQLSSHGGTLVGFNGGFHPKLQIQDYGALFAKIHQKYPKLTFYEMTIAEFMFSCKISKISYQEGAEILKSFGTEWITGGGAEILDDQFRMRHSPGKFKTDDYFKAQEAVLDAGLGSTATMVIGFDETIEERFNHLEKLRNFQEKVDRKLSSFLCWTYKPWNNELGGKEISTQDYLRWLAISRIYLHNFINIRTSVLTRNEDALLGLKYGANDFDIPTEDEVTEKAGATISLDFSRILENCENLGFKPIHREAWTRPSSTKFKERC
ncbi:MAG: radical SAM protein [Oligoflexales bacterium]|nr:radical SAM protein [Oligoflexales bacterium]